jgi:signal transduction histidine kinase
MHDSDHNHLHEEHLRFFGRMTASLSHDINNVFSTINELAGLIHDLDALALQGDRIAPDKIRRLTERISAQVGRGEILIRQLNRFAHAIDVPFVTFDARNMLEEVVALGRRHAERRGYCVVFASPDDSINIHANLFAMQHLVHACMDLLFDPAAAVKVVTASLHRTTGGATIVLQGPPLPGTLQAAPGSLTFIRALAESLAISLDMAANGRRVITLCVPGSFNGQAPGGIEPQQLPVKKAPC